MKVKSIISVALEIKSSDEDGTFEGHGATFGNVDLGGDICVKGCFQESLKEWKDANALPAMLFGHSWDQPVGDWLKVEEDDVGLYVKGKVWTGADSVDCSRKAYNVIRGTGRKAMSIGFITKEAERDRSGIRRLMKLSLEEISITQFPMNPKALITSAKDAAGLVVDPRTMEALLRDALGLSAREAKAFMAQGYSALVERDADTSEEVSGILASIKTLTNQIRA